MDQRFDPRLKSIFIDGVLVGPGCPMDVRLALDTGATRTVIRPSLLALVGYDIRAAGRATRMTAATGVQSAPVIDVSALTALGLTRPLSVIAHELPPSFSGQGLLGRDFFAGHVLTVDFARSLVRLRRPWGWPFGPRRLP